ncbi:MAG: hypothetical protein KAS57_03020, partial [Gammaproteobacteria bacterium]|nr:hypothetical protein [Gammaproteobacteria bacterium]
LQQCLYQHPAHLKESVSWGILNIVNVCEEMAYIDPICAREKMSAYFLVFTALKQINLWVEGIGGNT